MFWDFLEIFYFRVAMQERMSCEKKTYCERGRHSTMKCYCEMKMIKIASKTLIEKRWVSCVFKEDKN